MSIAHSLAGEREKWRGGEKEEGGTRMSSCK